MIQGQFARLRYCVECLWLTAAARSRCDPVLLLRDSVKRRANTAAILQPLLQSRAS